MESFYVTSTHLDIDMVTKPHPSGLVIFSRELSTNRDLSGHIIISPENHHTDIYCKYLEKNKPLLSERKSWGISFEQSSAVPNYFMRLEPANRKVSELAHQRLDIDPILVKMATQALGIVMEDSDILHRTDGETRLMHFPKDQLNEQSAIIY